MTMTEGGPATTAIRAGCCSSADADQPRRNLNCHCDKYCRRDQTPAITASATRTRRRKQPGGKAVRLVRPSLILVAVLLSSLAVLSPSAAAAAKAEAEAAVPPIKDKQPSRKRPRHRNTGDISHIISPRLHPHPEPTPEPSLAPSLGDDHDDDDDGDDDDMDDDSYVVIQPRNERPWGELLHANSTADQDPMDGRDGEEDPASDDGDLLNLLEQVDNGDATQGTATGGIDDAATKGTIEGGGGIPEIIDVSPFNPPGAPAAMPVVPPSAASPTAAPVTASPTKQPTLVPTKQPTNGELVELILR